MNPSPTTANRDKLLDAARLLLQTRGFNAFSYRDLAQEVGIKTSSIHYHFPTKEDLGMALVDGYTQALEATLRTIDQSTAQALQRLQKFIRIFEETATAGDTLCIAGMLASDFATLGADLQRQVQHFFQVTEAWLSLQMAQLDLERDTGHQTHGAVAKPRINKHHRQQAAWLMATLEGALLTGRALGEPQRIRQAGEAVLKAL